MEDFNMKEYNNYQIFASVIIWLGFAVGFIYYIVVKTINFTLMSIIQDTIILYIVFKFIGNNKEKIDAIKIKTEKQETEINILKEELQKLTKTKEQ